MTAQTAPGPGELLARTGDLLDLVAGKAAWGEENGRLHDDVVAALADAGVLRMRRPLWCGGLESDARTVTDVVAALARADGSTAWSVAAWGMSTWIAGLFPDHVQEEVFAEPGALVSTTLSPTGEAAPADGGVRISGSWHFISGATFATWQIVMAMAPTPDGEGLWPICALVPMSQLRSLGDWDTSGLCATDSVTTVAQDLFVPQDRVLPLPMLLAGQHASARNAGSAVFSMPLMPTGCASFAGVGVGLAEAARDRFHDRMPGRGLTYTDYDDQAEATLTHLQAAEAALRTEEARFHAHRLAAALDEKAAAGSEWSVADRVEARVRLGRAFDHARAAVDTVARASGGSSIQRTEPIQRIERDVHALTRHGLMHPETTYELYGRVLCGRPPNTTYL